MPRQNRVRPTGELVAVSARGLYWGNRGPLLNKASELARYSSGKNWIICVLEFHGRHRTQWRPGHLTELYFLDEATGLAAGHRPCGECRHHDYQAFKTLWQVAHPAAASDAKSIDIRLHADRLAARGAQRTYYAPLAELPSGTMITIDSQPHLITESGLMAWSFDGYQASTVQPVAGPVEVITPRATVAVLAAGYRPAVHPSAGVLR